MQLVLPLNLSLGLFPTQFPLQALQHNAVCCFPLPLPALPTSCSPAPSPPLVSGSPRMWGRHAFLLACLELPGRKPALLRKLGSWVGTGVSPKHTLWIYLLIPLQSGASDISLMSQTSSSSFIKCRKPRNADISLLSQTSPFSFIKCRKPLRTNQWIKEIGASLLWRKKKNLALQVRKSFLWSIGLKDSACPFRDHLFGVQTAPPPCLCSWELSVPGHWII